MFVVICFSFFVYVFDRERMVVFGCGRLVVFIFCVRGLVDDFEVMDDFW